MFDQFSTQDDELHKMQDDVLQNKKACMGIRESPLESNLKEAYDYLIQHSAHSKNFLDRAEKRFKEVGSDIANL